MNKRPLVACAFVFVFPYKFSYKIQKMVLLQSVITCGRTISFGRTAFHPSSGGMSLVRSLTYQSISNKRTRVRTPYPTVNVLKHRREGIRNVNDSWNKFINLYSAPYKRYMSTSSAKPHNNEKNRKLFSFYPVFYTAKNIRKRE